MVKMEAGMLARSKAGHDRNRIYVIIRADAEYVWLADGVHRTSGESEKEKTQTCPGNTPDNGGIKNV